MSSPINGDMPRGSVSLADILGNKEPLSSYSRSSDNNSLIIRSSQPDSEQMSKKISLAERLGSGKITTLTTQSSLLAPSKKHSSKFIVQSTQSGAMCSREDQAMLEEVKNTVNSTVLQVVAVREQIDNAIGNFYAKATEINDRCSKYAIVLADRICDESIAITPEQVEHFKLLMQMSEQVGNRHYELANQFMDVQKLNNEGKLGNYKGVVDLIFYARMKELEIFKDRLETFRDQESHEIKKEDHDLKIMMAIHNQQLKEETQVIDECLKMAKFDSKDDQRRFENNLKEREQRMTQEADLKKITLEEMNHLEENKLKELELKNQKEIEDKHSDMESKIEHHRIRAAERVKWGQIATQSVRPRCSIM